MSELSCPHEATTVAFAYGEAPDSHALHVAGCPACTEILAMHESVAGAVPLAALSRAAGSPPDRLARGGRTRWPVVVAGLTAAAAVAWAVLPDAAPPQPQPVAAEIEPVDAALDDLDLELTSLELELL